MIPARVLVLLIRARGDAVKQNAGRRTPPCPPRRRPGPPPGATSRGVDGSAGRRISFPAFSGPLLRNRPSSEEPGDIPGPWTGAARTDCPLCQPGGLGIGVNTGARDNGGGATLQRATRKRSGGAGRPASRKGTGPTQPAPVQAEGEVRPY